MAQTRLSSTDTSNSSTMVQQMLTNEAADSAAAAAGGAGGVDDSEDANSPEPAGGAKGGQSAKGKAAAAVLAAGKSQIAPAVRSTQPVAGAETLPATAEQTEPQSSQGQQSIDDVSSLSQQYSSDAASQQLDADTKTLAQDVSKGLPDDATLQKDISAFAGSMQSMGLGSKTGGAVRDLLDNGVVTGDALTHAYSVAKSAGVAVDTSTTAPDVNQATDDLTAALQADPTDTSSIMLGTAHLARAMREDGDSSDTISAQISSLAGASGVGPDASAAALVAAMTMGYQDPGSSTADATAVGSAQNLVTQINRNDQNQVAAQKQEAAAAAAAAAQQSSAAVESGSSSGAGVLSAPPTSASGSATAYGTQVPWTSFKQEGYAAGTFNNEEETYTTDGSNVNYNSNGSLTITAKHTDAGWTSARLVGNQIGSVPVYMNFSASTKSSAGGWPALWLTDTSNAWPSGGGEVDVMEQVNGQSVNNISTHVGSDVASKMDTHQQVALSGGSSATHDYGVYITSQGVQFYQDGVAVGSFVNMKQKYPNWDPTKLAPVLNYAVGGDMPQTSPTSTDPQSMTINAVTTSTKPPS